MMVTLILICIGDLLHADCYANCVVTEFVSGGFMTGAGPE